MVADPPADTVQPAETPPPRFGWPMRLFLCLVLFDMTFHSLTEAVAPYTEWLKEFGLPRFPKALPSWQEMAKLAADTRPDEPSLVGQRIGQSLASFPAYFNPSPEEEARKKLVGFTDWGRYAWCWLASRLDLFEAIFGLEQEWAMFSPN